MAEVGKDLWMPPCATALLNLGHLLQAAQDHVQTAFVSPRMEPPPPLWATSASAQSPSQ